MADVIVTTLQASVDPNDGATSLREAIAQAGASAGGDAITFDA